MVLLQSLQTTTTPNSSEERKKKKKTHRTEKFTTIPPFFCCFASSGFGLREAKADTRCRQLTQNQVTVATLLRACVTSSHRAYLLCSETILRVFSS